MSREEVSALGSARREEVRRQIENSERLKANPLLYLVSPQVKVNFIFNFFIIFSFLRFLCNHLFNLLFIHILCCKRNENTHLTKKLK